MGFRVCRAERWENSVMTCFNQLGRTREADLVLPIFFLIAFFSRLNDAGGLYRSHFEGYLLSRWKVETDNVRASETAIRVLSRDWFHELDRIVVLKFAERKQWQLSCILMSSTVLLSSWKFAERKQWQLSHVQQQDYCHVVEQVYLCSISFHVQFHCFQFHFVQSLHFQGQFHQIMFSF